MTMEEIIYIYDVMTERISMAIDPPLISDSSTYDDSQKSAKKKKILFQTRDALNFVSRRKTEHCVFGMCR